MSQISVRSKFTALYEAVKNNDLPRAIIIIIAIVSSGLQALGYDANSMVGVLVLCWLLSILTDWHDSHIGRFKTRTSLLKDIKL